jgi:hypothetical protein
MYNPLNQASSSEQRSGAADAVFDAFSKLLFERANLINGYSITSTDVTSTSNFGLLLRIPDTSGRNFMRPDRNSRMRGTFFMKQPASAECYILFPALYNSTATLTDFADLSYYVGLYIQRGRVFLISKGKRTSSAPTTINLGEGSPELSKTVSIEIKYNVYEAEFFINNERIGSITTDVAEGLYEYQTIYPLICPIRSVNGTAVQITFESFQILQDK